MGRINRHLQRMTCEFVGRTNREPDIERVFFQTAVEPPKRPGDERSTFPKAVSQHSIRSSPRTIR